jgi:sugar phosphate isomerase/epimerase
VKISESKNIKFAVQIGSIYDPAFWKRESFLDFLDISKFKPEEFWNRALEVIASFGFSGFELSFGTGSIKSAIAYYKAGDAFGKAAQKLGLQICGGFYSGLVGDIEHFFIDLDNAWKDPKRQSEILRQIDEYAVFLSEAGCRCMPIGVPIRKTWNDPNPCFVDAIYMQSLADLINRMAYITAKKGVRIAIHSESNSVFWLPRDIDMLLTYTDPVYVDFCPDISHVRSAGVDPADVIRPHIWRMPAFHWKECSREIPKTYPTSNSIFIEHGDYFTFIGNGLHDNEGWMKLLKDAAYRGWAVLEIPSSENLKDIKASISFIEEKLLRIYS